MAHSTVVINVVGLNRALLAQAGAHLQGFAAAGQVRTLRPVLPALTCTIQASMLTGLQPGEHGIVGNGWYDRALAEVHFWKQSNRLVGGDKVWDSARRRDPRVTTANLFWWYNMYSTVNYSVTPRPIYKADGRKIPDVYTEPADLRASLQAELGRFPLFNFWGPASSIASSRWIAEAAIRVHQRFDPTLTLIYLPHLDYALQKLGPGHPGAGEAAREIDAVVGRLLEYFQERQVRIVILSEYGIEPVSDAVAINRVLREAGLLRVREEDGLELLDPGASEAFAVADHQVAHVYLRNGVSLQAVEDLCRACPGVEQVICGEQRADAGLDHRRAGDLVLVARSGSWFTYHYWMDDARAPDFARTVDIHRKPGYDPLELFVDPNVSMPKLRMAWKLFKKSCGFRTLFDLIPLDPRLVRGSHGRTEQPDEILPVLITPHLPDLPEELSCWQVKDIILQHLFADPPR